MGGVYIGLLNLSWLASKVGSLGKNTPGRLRPEYKKTSKENPHDPRNREDTRTLRPSGCPGWTTPHYRPFGFQTGHPKKRVLVQIRYPDMFLTCRTLHYIGRQLLMDGSSVGQQ